MRLHQQVAFRTALVLARNAADGEEAAQDGFVKAWHALSCFDPTRLAKNTLLWERGTLLLRVEAEQPAGELLRIARSVR